MPSCTEATDTRTEPWCSLIVHNQSSYSGINRCGLHASRKHSLPISADCFYIGMCRLSVVDSFAVYSAYAARSSCRSFFSTSPLISYHFNQRGYFPHTFAFTQSQTHLHTYLLQISYISNTSHTCPIHHIKSDHYTAQKATFSGLLDAPPPRPH
jgi:hypothetical protein